MPTSTAKIFTAFFILDYKSWHRSTHQWWCCWVVGYRPVHISYCILTWRIWNSAQGVCQWGASICPRSWSFGCNFRRWYFYSKFDHVGRAEGANIWWKKKYWLLKIENQIHSLLQLNTDKNTLILRKALKKTILNLGISFVCVCVCVCLVILFFSVFYKKCKSLDISWLSGDCSLGYMESTTTKVVIDVELPFNLLFCNECICLVL